MATTFMSEQRLFGALVAQQFSVIGLDESQNTQPIVVDALKAVAEQAGLDFCFGFFGDPKQESYRPA